MVLATAGSARPEVTSMTGVTRLTRPAAVAVLVLALVALAAWQGIEWRAQRHDASEGAAALRVAKAEALALTTISSRTSDADVARLLAGATTSFRNEFEQQADSFRATLAADDVVSTGKVVSAGLVSVNDARAEVLVAASAEVRNKKSAEPAPRSYRLRVELEKAGSRWLVSGMEFVA
jgi:Mce-associated membrane protein